MFPLGLHIFTLLIIAAYGSEIVPNVSCNANHLLSENYGDIKIIPSNVSDTDATINSNNRTLKWPISTTTTTSPMIFKPTPTEPNQPSETTISALEELVPATFPNNVALPPPATAIVPQESVQFCGKKGNCYQWFDDQWGIELSGYKRCEPRDERRAKRYCCIPPKLIK